MGVTWHRADERLPLPRHGRLAAVVAVALVLVGLASGVVLLLGSDPLAAANAAGCCTRNNPDYTPMLATGLTNEGRVGIAVRSIEAPPHAVIRMEPENDTLRDVRGRTAFRPFDLAAGDSRWVAVVSTVAGCARRPDSFAIVRSVRVEFEVLGITRTTAFELPSGALAFGSHDGRTCSFLLDAVP